jgi:hypothetical protein
MNDLLKEAIADAKAVRETAMANAKIALEEAFTPRLQSMLSAKLAEEEELEEEDDDVVAEPAAEPVAEPAPEAPVEEEEDMPMDEGEYEDKMEEEEDMDLEEEDDMDLEEIIRELEGEMEADEEPVAEGEGEEEETVSEGEGEEEETVSEGDDEEVSIDEIIKALREEDGEEEEPVAEAEDKAEELEEAYQVIKFLKSKINEVNLLNAKLLFSNKLFRNYSLNENQKVKVIENFDRARTLREVKLVYSTLAESFTTTKAKRQIKESYASKPTPSTRPSKQVINEGNDLAARWKKLANI